MLILQPLALSLCHRTPSAFSPSSNGCISQSGFFCCFEYGRQENGALLTNLRPYQHGNQHLHLRRSLSLRPNPGQDAVRNAEGRDGERLTCRRGLWHSPFFVGAKVAQLAEHRIRNATVVGSNPTFGSTFWGRLSTPRLSKTALFPRQKPKGAIKPHGADQPPTSSMSTWHFFKASTTAGSNWVPEKRTISSRAACALRPWE